MLDPTKTKIAKFIIHRVGNKLREEGVVESRSTHVLTADLQLALLNYFLPPLQNAQMFRFTHSSDTHLNEMFAFSKQLFKDTDAFIPTSIKSLKHLYSTCDHPKTKAGEISFAMFDDVLYQGKPTQAFGIFKSERKDTFLTVTDAKQQILFELTHGIPTKRFDKGCLILNSEAQDGFRVLVVDTNTDETRFWHERFLGVAPVLDERFLTESSFKVCKQFVESQFGRDEEKADQLVTLQKAIHYFTQNENYDADAFADEVFAETKMVADFKKFTKANEKKTGVSVPNNFVISSPAVKKAKRELKRNIRLDTKMEVKLNFNDPDSQAQFVERGYDGNKKMFFYKLFFNKEV